MVLKNVSPQSFRINRDQSCPRQLGLADVMYEVPHLVKTISPDGWAGLLACSRQWRQLVHKYTSTMFLTDAADVATVAKGVWPRLSLVVLCNQHCTAGISHRFEDRSLQLLAQLNLSAGQLDCTALIVRSKPDKSQLDAAGQLFQHCVVYHRLTSAFAYLSSPTWQQLTRLTVTHLPSFARHRVLAHLASVSWPALTHLNLSSVNLAPTDIACLVQASWPELEHLDLQGCSISNADIQQLASAAWPELEALRLSKNKLDDEAAAHLVETSPWPNLNALWLDNNAFTAAGIHQLMQTSWPGLKELCVDNKMVWEGLPDDLAVNLGQLFVEGAAVKVPRYNMSADKWPELKAVDIVPYWSHLRAVNKVKHHLLAAFWSGLVCYAAALAPQHF